jgi:hypothetical protein
MAAPDPHSYGGGAGVGAHKGPPAPTGKGKPEEMVSPDAKSHGSVPLHPNPFAKGGASKTPGSVAAKPTAPITQHNITPVQ